MHICHSLRGQSHRSARSVSSLSVAGGLSCRRLPVFAPLCPVTLLQFALSCFVFVRRLLTGLLFRCVLFCFVLFAAFSPAFFFLLLAADVVRSTNRGVISGSPEIKTAMSYIEKNTRRDMVKGHPGECKDKSISLCVLKL